MTFYYHTVNVVVTVWLNIYYRILFVVLSISIQKYLQKIHNRYNDFYRNNFKKQDYSLFNWRSILRIINNIVQYFHSLRKDWWFTEIKQGRWGNYSIDQFSLFKLIFPLMQPPTDCDFKLFLYLTHRIWHHTNYFVNLISNTDIEHPIIFTITNPNAS